MDLLLFIGNSALSLLVQSTGRLIWQHVALQTLLIWILWFEVLVFTGLVMGRFSTEYTTICFLFLLNCQNIID